MRNKLGLLLLCVMLLSGCERGTATVGNEMTAPLDRIVQAVTSGNAGAYESAFPQTFCEQYQAQTGDLQDYLQLLLTGAREFDLDRYGTDAAITYELTAMTRLDVSSVEPYCQVFSPDFVCSLPTESLTDAAEISVTVYFGGSYDKESFDLTYTVLCIDGTWVLHPKHFGTVLKK